MRRSSMDSSVTAECYRKSARLAQENILGRPTSDFRVKLPEIHPQNAQIAQIPENQLVRHALTPVRTRNAVVRTGPGIVRTRNTVIRTRNTVIRTRNTVIRTRNTLIRTRNATIRTRNAVIRTGTGIVRTRNVIVRTAIALDQQRPVIGQPARYRFKLMPRRM